MRSAYQSKPDNTMNQHFSPREIVSELDRHIIGQKDAKRAVAIALRNRWRRLQLNNEEMRREILPKNILMIGPTGVGKTEIARRLARLSNAPFIKIEATKFTEIGYVGRDVEQIVRDLIEISINLTREKMREKVHAQAEIQAEERILNSLAGENSSEETRQKFRKMLRENSLKDKEIEIRIQEKSHTMPTIDVPGMPGAQMGMLNLNEVFGKSLSGQTKQKRMKVEEALDRLTKEEGDKLLNMNKVTSIAIKNVEENGIVFLDEIDKIAARQEQSSNISREGVQRDLLPLIEGTTVSTKYGSVKTDHILFICSGAFHLSKPSDLLPELQGRLPIRVELKALNEEDFRRILLEPEASLIKQYIALMQTEKVTLEFTESAINELARISARVNKTIENIGARRLHTVLEKILEEISFTATDTPGKVFQITDTDVRLKLEDLSNNVDLSKFIL